jgi:LysR family transcriptional regulator (chromosome initiation inhibitor)
MFDYKLIEAFAMVIIEGGFEKASRKLHLTQSAVSQRVKQLEDQHGQVLLQRTSPPQPSEAGVPLLVHYRQVKQLESDLHLTTMAEHKEAFTSLAIAVNADTLATWFFSAIEDLLQENKIVLDLYVDDQDRTHELLQEGKVWGCITTRKKPLQGCSSTYLGTVNYGVFSTKEFAEKWFSNGLTAEAFERAPMARYNRKDDLNSRVFALLLDNQPEHPPTFFIPSTEIYGLFVSEGKCYGILPEQQSKQLEASGKIMNLKPECKVEVELFWHSWNLKSRLMENFNRHLLKKVRKILRQP